MVKFSYSGILKIGAGIVGILGFIGHLPAITPGHYRGIESILKILSLAVGMYAIGDGINDYQDVYKEK